MQRMIGLSLVVLLMISFSLSAQMPGKLYVGAGVGTSFIETKPQDIGGEDLKIDKNGFAYKAFVGYKFIKLIGVEADYRNLGTVKDKVMDTEFESNVKGFDVFATGNLNLAMVELFAKAGYFFWSSEIKGGNISEKTDDGDFVWGFGAGLSFGNLGIRAEWENFNVGDLENLSMLSASVVFALM